MMLGLVYQYATSMTVVFMHAGSSVAISLEKGAGLIHMDSFCPGTVRLSCEGVNMLYLWWAYHSNGYTYSIWNVQADSYNLTFDPIRPYLNNSAFLFIQLYRYITTQNNARLNASVLLTVDLFELSRQNVTKIYCLASQTVRSTFELNVIPQPPLIGLNISKLIITYWSEALRSVQVLWTKLLVSVQ